MSSRFKALTGKWKLGKLLLLSVAVGCLPAFATYNSNLTGPVSGVLTYTSGVLLFSLSNQPTSNGTCNAAFFELDESLTADAGAFNRMYSRLLEAYATGTAVNVGYDDAGNCASSGYIQVYRIG